MFQPMLGYWGEFWFDIIYIYIYCFLLAKMIIFPVVFQVLIVDVAVKIPTIKFADDFKGWDFVAGRAYKRRPTHTCCRCKVLVFINQLEFLTKNRDGNPGPKRIRESASPPRWPPFVTDGESRRCFFSPGRTGKFTQIHRKWFAPIGLEQRILGPFMWRYNASYPIVVPASTNHF